MMLDIDNGLVMFFVQAQADTDVICICVGKHW